MLGIWQVHELLLTNFRFRRFYEYYGIVEDESGTKTGTNKPILKFAK